MSRRRPTIRRLCRVIVVINLAWLISGPDVVWSDAFAANACGDGRVDAVLEDFDSVADFTTFKATPAIPDPDLTIASGCHGQALALGYDLREVSPEGQSWIVLQHSIPAADVSDFTHLRIPMKSSMDSGDAVHSSERSDDGMIIVYQVVGMAKAASTLRRDSPLGVSR
jgi:hypothetical protein